MYHECLKVSFYFSIQTFTDLGTVLQTIFNWYYFLLPGDSTVTAINSCTRFCMADCTYVNSYERYFFCTVFISKYKIIYLFCLVVINSLFDTIVISSQGSSQSAHFQKPLR
jgi:hypothetical protein